MNNRIHSLNEENQLPNQSSVVQKQRSQQSYNSLDNFPLYSSQKGFQLQNNQIAQNNNSQNNNNYHAFNNNYSNNLNNNNNNSQIYNNNNNYSNQSNSIQSFKKNIDHYHINGNQKLSTQNQKYMQQQKLHEQTKQNKSQVINLMSDQQNDRPNNNPQNLESCLIDKDKKNIEVFDLRNEESDDQITTLQQLKRNQLPVHNQGDKSQNQMQVPSERLMNLITNPINSNILITGGNVGASINPYNQYVNRLQQAPNSFIQNSLGIPSHSYFPAAAPSMRDAQILGTSPYAQNYGQAALNYRNNIMKLIYGNYYNLFQ